MRGVPPSSASAEVVVRETSFLAMDLGDVRGDSLGVVVGVSLMVGVALASREASTFLEAGEVFPGGVFRPRGRLEREPGGVVCPRGNLPWRERNCSSGRQKKKMQVVVFLKWPERSS